MPSHWLFDPWTPWGAAMIVFSIACLVAGSSVRPLWAAVCCLVATASMTLTSPLPFVPTCALLGVPAHYAWLAPMLRTGKIKPDAFLAMALLPVGGLLGAFVEYRLASVIAAWGAIVVSRKSRFESHGPVLVIGILPTLGELVVLMFAPELLRY